METITLFNRKTKLLLICFYLLSFSAIAQVCFFISSPDSVTAFGPQTESIENQSAPQHETQVNFTRAVETSRSESNTIVSL